MILFVYSVIVAFQVFAAPATPSQPQIPLGSTQNATGTNLTGQATQYSGPLSSVFITIPLSISSTSVPILTNTPTSQLTQSYDRSSGLSVAFSQSPIPSSPSVSFEPLSTSTLYVTEVVTILETPTTDPVPSASTTITATVTTTATPSATVTSSPSWDNRTIWVAPPQMTDLSGFNITYFPSGHRNLRIIPQVPAEAVTPTAKLVQISSLLPNATAPSAILQLVYPAQSVNPGSKPEGGADFYASPLDLAGARNVTLAYSVFFPADFNWVKGGKLPGLYGGHTGCSGGASARDCFSTRLMWRPRGMGELYLYAPKDKQTEALCADVASVCDATYGFSVGRGAFNFTAGDWTHLQQNVVLNTPGENDGTFTLFVNGQRMINRTDMFYRNVVPQVKKYKSASKTSIIPPRWMAVPLGLTAALDEDEDDSRPPEFLGLFFSTFFGGHGKAYATPQEQYTWFRNFAIVRHD